MFGKLAKQLKVTKAAKPAPELRRINTEKYAGGRGATKGDVRAEKRGAGRIRCSTLECELGRVDDLSSSGIRVHAKRKPTVEVDQTLELNLRAEDEVVTSRARVVWIRVDEACEFDIGLQLLHVDDAKKRRLIRLATTAQATDGLTRGWAPMF